MSNARDGSIGNERDLDDVAEPEVFGRPRAVTVEPDMPFVNIGADLDDTHVLLGKLALLVSKWRRLGDMRSDCAQELDELIEEHVDAL